MGVVKPQLNKILLTLTYYNPYISGLSIYAERLSETLAAHEFEVTVLTSQHRPSLVGACLNGVRVHRVPILARLGKAVIMPRYLLKAWQLLRKHDLVNIHVPQLEAAPVAFLAKLMGRPIIITYHCDLQLPEGKLNRIIDRLAFIGNCMAGIAADRIIAYTDDYAQHSPFLRRFRHKVAVIPPPVEMPTPRASAIDALRDAHQLHDKIVVGVAASLAAEKGIEYLLAALPRIIESIPNAHVLFAGPYEDVLGEEQYHLKLQPELRKYRDRWTFLGPLDVDAMAAFYATCAVTVLPSINSTESFGMVQVESMLCGTPVCASDLAGVRVPIAATGMGEIVPPKDAVAIADAIIRIVRRPEIYRRPRSEISAEYSNAKTLQGYRSLFNDLCTGQQPRSVARVSFWLLPFITLSILIATLRLSAWKRPQRSSQ